MGNATAKHWATRVFVGTALVIGGLWECALGFMSLTDGALWEGAAATGTVAQAGAGLIPLVVGVGLLFRLRWSPRCAAATIVVGSGLVVLGVIAAVLGGPSSASEVVTTATTIALQLVAVVALVVGLARQSAEVPV